MPLLKGRAAVDMKVKVKDNPNLEECVFRIVLDGYNAPVTSGNFLDLVERHFYDGMEIQRGNKYNGRHAFLTPSGLHSSIANFVRECSIFPFSSLVGEKCKIYT